MIRECESTTRKKKGGTQEEEEKFKKWIQTSQKKGKNEQRQASRLTRKNTVKFNQTFKTHGYRIWTLNINIYDLTDHLKLCIVCINCMGLEYINKASLNMNTLTNQHKNDVTWHE